MKKIIYFLSVFICFYLIAEDTVMVYSGEFGSIEKTKDYYLFYSSYPPFPTLKVKYSDIITEENGYQYIKYENEKILLIQGNNDCIPLPYDNQRKKMPFEFYDILRIDDMKSFLLRYKNDLQRYGNEVRAVFEDEGIFIIRASSFYSECLKTGNVEYVSDYLQYFFYFLLPVDNFIIIKTPWVAGKERNETGLGEYLDIEFTEPQDNIVVLNGYVDPLKKYLYKANNRVKIARIKSLDTSNPFEIEYEFKDYVYLAEIDFPAKVNKVRFTIKDVYKGEKWNDTCVSAVVTKYNRK